MHYPPTAHNNPITLNTPHRDNPIVEKSDYAHMSEFDEVNFQHFREKTTEHWETNAPICQYSVQ